ncbi:hypothetical protein RSAG8_12463, partial [Rhizoctonia solani AG-8 WAC10335]
MFDFKAHKVEIDARDACNSPKTLTTVESTLEAIPPAARPFFELLASAAATITGASAAPLTAPNKAMAVPTEDDKPILDFLIYAKANYQVNLVAFQEGFVRDRIGPDVMEDLDIPDLVEYGVRRGDIYRLKRAARAWEEEACANKARRIEAPEELVAKAPEFTIAFDDCPSPPPPGYVRSEAERLGKPRRGKKGNFCWQQNYPGEEGGYTFWADLPSPTLPPNDGGLAPMGTVQLRVASGTYIDVVRVPRPEIVSEEFDDDE